MPRKTTMLFFSLYFFTAFLLGSQSYHISLKSRVVQVTSPLRDYKSPLQPKAYHTLNRLEMAAKSGGGGSTKLDRKTVQKKVTKPTYKEEIEKDWRLILHDDTVHTIQQVCDIVSLCCPLCTGNVSFISSRY